GRFFTNASLADGCQLPTNSVQQLRLLGLLTQPELDLDKLTEIIKGDLGLSYSLLRQINSVHFGLRDKVISVHHALILMGEKQIRAWAGIATLASLNTTHNHELIVMSAARARL